MASRLTIPDAWLMGATQSGMTVREAVAHWLEQERMEREFDAQRAALARVVSK